MNSENQQEALRACLRRFSTMTAELLRTKPDIYDQTFTPFETIAVLWLLEVKKTGVRPAIPVSQA